MLVYQRVTFTLQRSPQLDMAWLNSAEPAQEIWLDPGGLLAVRGALVHQGWKLSLGTGTARFGMIGMEFPPIFISNLEETARKERSTRKISRMMSTYVHCPDRVVVTFLCLIHGDIFRLPFWGSTNNPAIQGANWTNQWADESYHWQSKGRLCRAASKLEPFKSAF